MRLWAEERKSGTIELLMTLPITTGEAILGKFLAAWLFIGVALALTFPMWITVNFLGNPDNGVILAGYLGSFLMAGAFLAIGSCISALTKNQVIAFIVAATLCFLFVMSGVELVLNFFRAWAPAFLVAGDRVDELPQPLRPDREAASSRCRRFVFYAVADRLLPVRQRHRRRAAQGRLRDYADGHRRSKRLARNASPASATASPAGA